MKTTGQSGWRRGISVVLLVVTNFAVGPTLASEVTVQNDSLSEGELGLIQAGFVAGESAAVWLTSPCNGNSICVAF